MTGEEREKGRAPYSSISLPASLMEEVEEVVRRMGYWPTKTAFIREAVIEKLERYKRELET
ncbi:MAG: ribbon-helix-helix domain-containing protein [Candidatus Bathyarchaeia archaeon]